MYKFLKQACYHLWVRYSLTATDSSKTMIQSIVASIRGQNWLNTPLTSGQHLQKFWTVTLLRMCGQVWKPSFVMSTTPHNLESLKDGIQAFWKTLTPEKCWRYIDHMHTVIPKVIEKGAASGYRTLSLINSFLAICYHCLSTVISIPRLKSYGHGYVLFLIN